MLGLPTASKRLDCCWWFIKYCPGKVLSNTGLAPKAQPDKHCPAVSRHWTMCIYLMLDAFANAYSHWDDKNSRGGWANCHVMALNEGYSEKGWAVVENGSPGI